MIKNNLCTHKKYIISEREFYFTHKGTRLICLKCGFNKFIKDSINNK